MNLDYNFRLSLKSILDNDSNINIDNKINIMTLKDNILYILNILSFE